MAQRSRTLAVRGWLPALAMLLGMGLTAGAATRYVVEPGKQAGTPTPPYESWATAATNLAQVWAGLGAGDTVIVSSGVYRLTAQVTVNGQTLRSWKNGALDRDGTILNGNYPTLQIRGVQVGNGLMEGFTVTNCYSTGRGGGIYVTGGGTARHCRVTGNTSTSGGGGIAAYQAGSMVSNCVIEGNVSRTAGNGGGVWLRDYAQMWNCRVERNTAMDSGNGGGGLWIGAGAAGSAVFVANCEIVSNKTENSTGSHGGAGVISAENGVTLRDCLIAWNDKGLSQTGGFFLNAGSKQNFENCTIAFNNGLGFYSGQTSPILCLTNTIVYSNMLSGTDRPWQWDGGNLSSFRLVHSCVRTTNSASATIQTITNHPLFAGPDNPRLSAGSPCLNAGTNQPWMHGSFDLDGNPRIDSASGLVDMGCYEYAAQAAGTSKGTLFQLAWRAQTPPPDPDPEPSDTNSAWAIIGPAFTTPAEYVGNYGAYRSPLLFDDNTPVQTPAQWIQRRSEVRNHWLQRIGPWPATIAAPTFTVDDTVARDGYTESRLSVEVWPGTRQGNFYLLTPTNGPGPFPAVLVVSDLATTYSVGLTQKVAYGVVDFGRQLVKRGFVTLSISRPDLYPIPDAQPLSSMGYKAANCRQFLANRPGVDANRIGIIGHSFGSKWALFASCLNDGFACAVWSDGGCVFDESRGNVNYWEKDYLGWDPATNRPPGPITPTNPRTGAYKVLVEDDHRDLHELHALMAPRPFLVDAGADDFPARWTALNHAVAVNDLLGCSNRVALIKSRDGHYPTTNSNEKVAAFFEYVLKEMH